MKRGKKIQALLTILFCILFFSSNIAFGYSIAEENDEAIVACHDENQIVDSYDDECDFYGYKCEYEVYLLTDEVTPVELDLKDDEITIEYLDENQIAETSFVDECPCAYGYECECYLIMTDYIIIGLDVRFVEGYRQANEQLVLVIYEDGIEVARSHEMRWTSETSGHTSALIPFSYDGPTREWVAGWFLDDLGVLTWRVELPTNVRAIGATTGTATVTQPPAYSRNCFDITLELARVTTPPGTNQPESGNVTGASPQTSDNTLASLTWYLISIIFALAGMVFAKKITVDRK